MDWTDEGIVLSALAHGENAAVVTLLTPAHGRHAGLVPGGQGRRSSPTLQPGNRVDARWRARVAEQLGTYTLELQEPVAARWLNDPQILALIASACAVTEASLPERQPLPALYAALAALFALEDRAFWAPAYVTWELGVLQALGYGLNLSVCALTGAEQDLAFVSPRTGRAVTKEAAAPYAEKLLPLPAFLCPLGREAAAWDAQTIRQGLDLTGHFLARHVFAHPQSRRLVPTDGTLPLARQRILDFYPIACADEPE